MKWIPKAALCQCICAIALAAAALVTPAAAQDGNIRSVTFYTVKSDRVSDFQAEIKAYNALLAKGSSTHYGSVWMSVTGPHEYAHVIMYKNWADLDYDMAADTQLKGQAMDLERIAMRINDCAVSSRRVIEEILPEYNISSDDVPKMIRVLQTQVRPEKYHDYLELLKHDIFPAVKKAGTKDYNVAVERFGESNMQITSVAGFNSWADLDAGVGAQKALSKDDYQALLDKVRASATGSEYDIYRFQPDLSYLPPPTAK
jgi:hypothetical protein